MGFTQGLQAGANIVLNKQAQDRNDRQQNLTALSQGYTLDDNGQWEPTDLKNQQDSIESSKLKLVQSQLKATQDALKEQESYQFANSMANLTNSWVDGNFEDAYKDAHQTPGFMDKLRNAPSLDFQDFSQINFSNPQDIQKLRDMGINTSNLDDKSSQDALQSSFMKVQGKDGKSRIVPIDSIINQTNSYEHYNKGQRDIYDNRLGFINDTLKGLTIPQQEANKSTVELATQKNDVMSTAINKAEADPENSFNIMMSGLLKTKPELFVKGKLDPNKRRDALRQINVAMERAGIKPGSALYKSMHERFVNTKLEGTGSTRENSDISQNMSGIKMGEELLNNNKEIDKDARTRKELELIDSDSYKTYKAKKESFDGEVLNVKAFGRFKDRFNEAVNSGVYKSGYFDSFKNWVAQITPESMSNLSGMSNEQIMKVVGLEGTMGMEVARYLKEMSGTAASEEEAKRTMDYIVGTTGMQEKARSERLNNFYSNLKKRAGDNGRSLIKAGFVGNTYDKYKSLSTPSREEMIKYLKENK